MEAPPRIVAGGVEGTTRGLKCRQAEARVYVCREPREVTVLIPCTTVVVAPRSRVSRSGHRAARARKDTKGHGLAATVCGPLHQRTPQHDPVQHSPCLLYHPPHPLCRGARSYAAQRDEAGLPYSLQVLREGRYEHFVRKCKVAERRVFRTTGKVSSPAAAKVQSTSLCLEERPAPDKRKAKNFEAFCVSLRATRWRLECGI